MEASTWSIDTAHSSINFSVATGSSQRCGGALGPSAARWSSPPTTTKVEKAAGDRYLIQGDLTIRDATRLVTLEAEYGGEAKDPWGNQRVAFAATTSINRGDFGLQWNQVLETGGVLVGERIDIELEVQAVQATATPAT